MTVTLPPFPVDDSALDMLTTALNPGPDAERTSLGDLLSFYSQMAGSDVSTVAEELDDEAGDSYREYDFDRTAIMLGVSYSPNDLIRALIAEVRRLRADTAAVVS